MKPVDEPKKNVLVVDDEENMRHMLAAMLTREGYQVETAANGAQALEMVAKQPFDFILCDIKMPRMDGLAFLAHRTEHFPDATVIMMSAYGTIDTAVEALKHGAYDYISKPFKSDEVLLALKKASERERLKRENIALRQQIATLGRGYTFGKIIAKSKAMQAVTDLITKVAAHDTTVLVTGESGTGKELVARSLHFNSPRAPNALIPVNCGGIPENLLESELFGHVKGAFTGADKNKTGLCEIAHKGTLFLDEIGELPASLQVKLLRLLQDREIRPVGASATRTIDIRIVAATARNLEADVAEGVFREDLFYRLNVLHIHLPPLRDRQEDIPLLIETFVQEFNKKLDKTITGLAPAALSRLLAHTWPGNVRELENLIERAVVLAEGDTITPDDLPPGFGTDSAGGPGDALAGFDGYSIKAAQKIFEKRLIEKALAKTGGNRTRTSKLLEISHPSLLAKMKEYGIEG
ncbi:sigma-54-dependent transcriptional regulator [Desulfosudis oleivorans]|uniref:Two component, sigma54 specific, transcriptional regulator, Fis family n=1 Tax=Desulfosudis oleivorans (strain DSM 6200 / JCM 39069 / Hxd3) TaxID=96561 RepID=A9A0V6_DESOH|nr:sigma-54 dependent transcriptional regulator [Desulfosudis oleivorans]ABW67581.1 two component, sigma54 specific, transcriptional regulator, Fis family [Desulfosudis oleivorans Hxd3]